MKREWVISLRDQCRKARVQFFFKQWGGVRKHLYGRELDGRTYDDAPSLSPNRIPIDSKRLHLIDAAEAEAASFVSVSALAGD
jgi:hypothetical protein